MTRSVSQSKADMTGSLTTMTPFFNLEHYSFGTSVRNLKVEVLGMCELFFSPPPEQQV